MYDLIIFDCDGTLVDSEYLNNKVSADLLTEFGLEGYTAEKCIEEFGGKSWTDIKKILDARHNVDIPQTLIDDYVRRLAIEIEKTDVSIAGAKDFVIQCNENYKIAVGSNGERFSVLNVLKLQGFMGLFSDSTVFTKVQVPNGKPAPDLFLFAADQMGVAPNKCLVIEDSPTGATAGVTAGMDVFGFTGAAHDPKTQAEKLKAVGVKAIYHDFIHMAQALGY